MTDQPDRLMPTEEPPLFPSEITRSEVAGGRSSDSPGNGEGKGTVDRGAITHPPGELADRPVPNDDPGGPDVGRGALSVPASPLMEMIWRAAKDPEFDIAKFEALARLQEHAEDRQAEAEFAEAFARLQAKMPRVQKNGRVELGAGRSYPFARFEDMDRVLRPLYTAEGFTLSFDTERAEGGTIVTAILRRGRHHTKASTPPLPLDTGPGRNNLQAAGSSMMYGRRYACDLVMNIVRVGDDDDGVRGGDETITDQQVAELSRLMTDASFSERSMYDLLGVTALTEVKKSQLAIARNAVAMRKRQRGAA